MVSPLGRAQQRRELGEQPSLTRDDRGAQLLVEGEVEEQPQRRREQRLLLVRHEGRERHDERRQGALLSLRRLLPQRGQVLLEDGELHQEEEREHEQLGVLLAPEHRREQPDDPALCHLALHLGLLRQIQQHVEADVEQLLLLADLEPILLLLERVGVHRPALLLGLGLLELAQARPLRLALDHLEYVGAHARLREQLVELRKVGERVQDVQDVDREVHRLGTLLLQ